MKKEKTLDKNLYNEQNLNLLNIRELRVIGRKLGVPAPATLKKQALVEYILKIVYGEIEPPKRNACGRPSVRNLDMQSCISKIMQNTDYDGEIEKTLFGGMNSVFKVASPESDKVKLEVEQRFFVEDDGKYYLRKYSFVATDGDIELSKAQKERYGLANFDVVEAIISGKSFKIVSINGNSDERFNKNLKDMSFGTKQVFHLSTKEEIKTEITKLIKNNEKTKVSTIIFSEDSFAGKNVVSLKAVKNAENAVAYKNIMQFVNTCEKHVFDGETIVVVTDQSAFIENVIESFDSDVSSRIKKNIQEKINNLFALGNELVIYKKDTGAIYQ